MHSPAPHDRERQILALWERGVGLGRWQREDALLAAGGGAPQALGARNAALLALRGALFDRAWSLTSRCPACNADCAFAVDALALAEQLNAFSVPGQSAIVDCAGRPVELRAPTADDLRAVSALPDAASAARCLLARCVDGGATLDDLDDQALAELGSRLERLDPGALVSFTLCCPACSHAWSGDVDVGEALWSELQRAAERSLIEIDALARAYGWTEHDVLRLSPSRRAAYLQLVGAS
jgi:hypothetical protein